MSLLALLIASGGGIAYGALGLSPRGASSFDLGTALVTGADGDVTVVGRTHSPDFPVTTADGGTHGRGERGDAFLWRSGPDLTPHWVTYLGGSSDDGATSVAVDSQGNVVVGGRTDGSSDGTAAESSEPFPTTPGAFQSPATTDGRTGFVAKFSPEGALLWSTLLGGSDHDYVADLVTDADGNVYVAGSTGSPDFPFTEAPRVDASRILEADQIYAGSFSPDGDLRWLVHVGEGVSEIGVALDSSGSLVVAATTYALDDPEAVPTSDDGDILLAKLLKDGSFIWKTRIGGSREDRAGSVATSSDDSIIVGGRTASDDFPSPLGLERPFQGETDGLMAKLSPLGFLIWSAYVGGTGADDIAYVSVDSKDHIAVAGRTDSPDFPGTRRHAAPHQGEGGLPRSDVYVVKLTPNGRLRWGAVVGGSDTDSASGTAIDAEDRIYVTGITMSVDFPAVNPYASTTGGGADAFVLRFSPDGDLQKSSLLGESDVSRFLRVLPFHFGVAGLSLASFGLVYLRVGRTAPRPPEA